MPIQNIELDDLKINKANDRHGELESEPMAIAWLFSHREAHMRNLAKDIATMGRIFEIPLVAPDGAKFTVFDGNRRITCLKLLSEPRRAPTAELHSFFVEQKALFAADIPAQVECQVESGPDRGDAILFRRHTGTQNGVGQLTWDDRMKATFVGRTGQGGEMNVADEIETLLKAAGKLPQRKIPRSTMNRLLSAEPFRNRLGFSVSKGRFEFTHDEVTSVEAMARVAHDLSEKKLVLGQIWDVDGKRAYLDGLEREGVLPTVHHSLPARVSGAKSTTSKVKPGKPPKPTLRTTLIPHVEYSLPWPGRLQRQHQIWEELQFHLELGKHPNAISVLFRVLIELAMENYITQAQVPVNDQDKLAARLEKIGKHLAAEKKLDQKQIGILTKFKQSDKLVSADTLNRYVHSPNFAPSPEHLASMWDSLADVIVLCLRA